MKKSRSLKKLKRTKNKIKRVLLAEGYEFCPCGGKAQEDDLSFWSFVLEDEDWREVLHCNADGSLSHSHGGTGQGCFQVVDAIYDSIDDYIRRSL